MASTINSTTSSGVVITSDNTGSLALQSAGTTIATISSTGLTMNSGNIVQASGAAPAFSAYRSTNQTPTTNTWTKIQLNVEEFDTNSNFDSTTNYRFTPTVAGYYEVSALIDLGGAGVSFVLGGIYKNGSLAKYIGGQTTTTEAYINGGYLFSMNGSTDYLELYVYITATTPTVYAGSTAVSFSGFLARSA